MHAMDDLKKLEQPLDIGFAVKCEPWLLRNKFFPSKYGGMPAFLELKNLPSSADLKCGICSDPMIFLCQLYAPNEERDDCFHRTIFLFICPKGDCCQPNSNANLAVFRSQLARKNNYYAFEAPDEDEYSDEVSSPVNLCRVCGARAPSACSRCKAAFYCSAVHQRFDWPKRHSAECKAGSTLAKSHWSDLLFPENEIVIGPEEQIEDLERNETVEEAEERCLKEFEELRAAGKTGTLEDIPLSELDKYTDESVEDKTFKQFKKRTKGQPEQIVRYHRHKEPLWITDEHKLAPEGVPDCEKCGGKRTFEFQVMPQLLNSLKRDDLDWGTLVVYTCAVDCDTDGGYVREFVYKQDIVQKEEPKV